jgi:bacterioferritin-associated ferredoxin
MMRPEDELCLCFHVTRRKVEQYLRTQRPAVASQLSECYGAGTGCGWCRPFLKRLHQQFLREAGVARGDAIAAEPVLDAAQDRTDFPDANRYAQARDAYRDSIRQAPESGADPAADRP